MQFRKKTQSLVIMTLLVLSILVAAAPAFAVLPSFAVSAGGVVEATVGTTIAITGSGASPGGQIQFYWDNLAGALLNSTYASGDVTATFAANVNVPDTVAGVHYIIAYDVPTGSTSTTGPIYIDAAIVLSPTTGIPADVITVNGTGFVPNRTFNVTFYNTTGTTIFSANVTQSPNRAGATGNFSTTFVVPAVDYGIYVVNVTQQVGNTATANATANFNVNSTITLTPTTGPQGSVIAVTGRGFRVTAGVPITITAVSGGVNYPVRVLAPIVTVAGGTFSGSFVLNNSALTGTLVINATDGTNIGAANFRVRGVTGITVTPTSGAPGNTIAITGSNFTAIAGTSVAVRFATLPLLTLTTDAAGGISGTFSVPSLPTTGYTIVATDANGLTASTPFAIAITYVTVTPTAGPTGSSVLVTAYGFSAGSTANVTLGTKVLGTTSTVPTYNVAVDTLQTTGISFVVPQLAVGSYTVTVRDQNGLTGTSTFGVTATSTLTATPASAPAGATITVVTNNFGNTALVSFTFKNATATYITASATTNSSGYASATMLIPAGTSLGAYVINATDSQGFTVEIAFTVIPATTTVNTRATTYKQGDVLSFNIQLSFPTAFTITVYDPQGTPDIIQIYSENFVLSNALYVYPYATGAMWGYTDSAQMILPADAVVGTWTWNATVLGIVKTGTFSVTAVGSTLTDITAKLDALNQTLLAINGTSNNIYTLLKSVNATVIAINGNTATLSTSVGTITTSISSMQSSIGSVQSSVSTLTGSVSSISSGIATIQTNLGTVQTAIGNIDPVVGLIAGDTTTIKTSLGTITTSLSSIGTTVTSISGDTATIKTDIGTLSGTVTSVKDGVATIQTSLGTMQTSVGNLQSSVNGVQSDVTAVKADVGTVKGNTGSLSPLIIVAIVLALIAAIAAIASIFLMRKKIAG